MKLWVRSTAALAALAIPTAASAISSLNEVVLNDIGTDDHQFVELCGTPNMSQILYIIQIEGEGSGKGRIDYVQPVFVTFDANGFFVVGDPAVNPDEVLAFAPENGGNTILLASGFSGSVGDDVDTDDDGVADAAFPGTLLDGVGFANATSGDAVYYGAPVLGPDTGDMGDQDFDVAGAARCGDCDGQWGFICLEGTEPTGAGCDTNNPFNPYVVSYASPGMASFCAPVSVDTETWGHIKAGYR